MKSIFSAVLIIWLSTPVSAQEASEELTTLVGVCKDLDGNRKSFTGDYVKYLGFEGEPKLYMVTRDLENLGHDLYEEMTGDCTIEPLVRHDTQ